MSILYVACIEDLHECSPFCRRRGSYISVHVFIEFIKRVCYNCVLAVVCLSGCHSNVVGWSLVYDCSISWLYQFVLKRTECCVS